MPALATEMAGQRVTAPGPAQEVSAPMQDQAYKRCSKCGETKAVEEFHRRPRASDGLTSWCGECGRNSSREWHARNAARVRRARREEYAEDLEASRARNRARFRQRGELNVRYERERASTPELKARQALRHAVQSGAVQKPSTCEVCGGEVESRRLHGHHEDYSKPLDVEWLCTLCHGARHRLDNEDLQKRRAELKGRERA